MKVIISDLQKNINKLTKHRDNYESYVLNYYNQVNSLKSCWNTGKANTFYDNSISEKNFSRYNVDALDEVISLLEYILSSYEDIGNKIDFDLYYRNSIINAFNNYIRKLESLITALRNLDQSEFIYAERNKVTSMLNKYVKELDILNDVKNDFTNCFDEIEKNESNIKNKIGNLIINDSKLYLG